MTNAVPPDIEAVCRLGWRVYPCRRDSKAGFFGGAAEAATCDLRQIERWERAFNAPSWRVVCGPSGLFALDVDRAGDTHKADGFAELKKLCDKNGSLPPRPMTRTGGSGGAVLFFKHQGEPISGRSGKLAPGLDPHRGPQAIMLPPSTHPITKGAYSWRVAPWDVAPPPIPGWLAKLLAPPPEPERPAVPYVSTSERAMRALSWAKNEIRNAARGSANDTLNRAAYWIGRHVGAGSVGQSEAFTALYNAALDRKIPGREALATIKSGLGKGRTNPIEAYYV